MVTKTNVTAPEPNLEKPVLLSTSEDLKNALLVVSVTINLFFFTAWLVVQTDPGLASVIPVL